MASLNVAGREVDTDIRAWGGDLRREASLVLGGLAALFVLAALVYFLVDARGSGWFLWTSLAVLVVLLLAEAAVLVTGIAREEEVGPPWLANPDVDGTTPSAAGGAAPRSEPAPRREEPAREIDLECPACSEAFAVEDTGERPLEAECPHCGAAGEVNLDEEPPDPHDHADHEREHHEHGAAQPGAAEPAETIELKCPACETEFETEDTGERPLATTCPGCGRSGKLG